MVAPDQSAWAPVGRPQLHTFVPRERRVGPLLLWIATLLGGLALLVWLGDGELASPDLTAPSTWSAWLAARGTATAVVSVLRIVALGLAWYLVGITSVSVVAHAARAVRLVKLADALSFGPIRLLVQQALGVSLAVGVVATALPSQAVGGGSVPGDPSAGSTVSALPLTDVPGLGGAADAVPASPDESIVDPPIPAPAIVATPQLVDADGTRSDAATQSDTGAPSDTGATPDDVPLGETTGADANAGDDAADDGAGDTTPREVRVRAGDHLWGIAEEDLHDALGREPSEREVVEHWHELIAVNADRLVVPSNPDLLHPGQLLVLPDVEVAP